MIRFFNELDFKDIYRLGKELSNNFSSVNNLDNILKDKYTKILVYEKDKKVIGFLIYTELIDTIDIIDIIVDKEYRNRKVASCLIDYLITGLKADIKMITLEVRESNDKAINLYKKFGFEKISVRKNYYEKDNENAYLMVRSVC